MKIMQLITPIADVRWLAVTDTVRDAFDHMETYGETAAPLLDWSGRYIGTVVEADLRRHLASLADQTVALATRLDRIERRSRNLGVTAERDVDSVVEQAFGHRFVPVVDGQARLIGIVARRRILDARLPSAA